MTYKTTLGICVFGEPSGYSADALISEFKSFVEANSQFNLAITVNKYPALADDEICLKPYSNCADGKYWAASKCLREDTKAKFLKDVHINMMMFDIKGKTLCFGGACECWQSLNDVPLVMIPLGAWPNLDNNPGGPWRRALSQTLVHEWMHGMDWILEQLGHPELPSSDSCGQYGYTGTNDPGWGNCLKFFLSTITTKMYEDIQNWGKPACITPACSLQIIG